MSDVAVTVVPATRPYCAAVDRGAMTAVVRQNARGGSIQSMWGVIVGGIPPTTMIVSQTCRRSLALP